MGQRDWIDAVFRISMFEALALYEPTLTSYSSWSQIIARIPTDFSKPDF